MNKHHAIAIVAGLAVGAFIGYEASAKLATWPIYSSIWNYYNS
jgi:hypothetical protein